MPAWQKKAVKPFTEMIRIAVIATYPQYMRDLAGLHQGGATDVVAIASMKAFHKLLKANLALRIGVMAYLAPPVIPAAAPALLGMKPKSDKIWEVREAQEHFGFDIPSQAHPDVRAKQRDRVFNKGLKPLEDGLEESQKYIGSMDVHHPEKVG